MSGGRGPPTPASAPKSANREKTPAAYASRASCALDFATISDSPFLLAKPIAAPDDFRMSQGTAWLVLVIAGLLEVAWAIGLKYTEGFTRLWPSIGTLAALAASMLLLAQAARTLPIGTAYAVWVGIGALGAAILGIVLFHEPAAPLRVFFLALLLVSIVGLKATAS